MQLVDTIYGYKKDITIGKLLTGTYEDFILRGFSVYEGDVKFDVMAKPAEGEKITTCICTVIFKTVTEGTVDTATITTSLAISADPKQCMTVFAALSKAAQSNI